MIDPDYAAMDALLSSVVTDPADDVYWRRYPKFGEEDDDEDALPEQWAVTSSGFPSRKLS